ncbi:MULTISPECIES: M48 family metallopeptidase [unclassified Methylophaga]|jgi:STE24 endopeptidase|uniref:M48 family metallopeptidase n=1 Tax=unclassified Methylophaga TaxID=2629249 RepID=UPI000C994232|nr:MULTISPECIES: M48 family metallopeptidase [unclassified Methylophaga]MAK67958.1 peptidase M48 [Methylophaga sp.]MAY16733.1 peptidase M48 [Methylophaga sp.]MBN46839.1 peptidase M48 [Methylophaga sp.]|tara:strand:- start:147215 stop:148462 length:1248 start_codon:yes stop_codon:yes gene_type:complete
MNEFSWIFLIALALMTGIEIWLSLRQRRHVLANRDEVPAAFREQIGLAAHQKAADYTAAKGAQMRRESLFGAVVLILWTLGGGLALLSGAWESLGWSAMTTGVVLILSFLLIGSILELPLSWYRTFVMEEKFGFNRNTPALFMGDFAKQLLLMLVLGAPIAWVTLWLMNSTGDFWWLYLWAAWMVFAVVMMWAYPAFIAPLFNKFTPLDDANLKQKVESLLQRCGFKSQGIYVMDGSRRSGHGNAYFTGLGNNKRIVFFDTLLNTLNEDQIEAVLAHELGHFRRKHVIKNMLMMAVMSLVGLALLGWASTQTWFYSGLGVETQNNAIALILFMLVIPVFSFFLHPLMTSMSRKYEFEADAYAASVSSADDLITALVALYKENASTLTPDPLVSAIYDSHPPASLRIAALQTRVAG